MRLANTMTERASGNREFGWVSGGASLNRSTPAMPQRSAPAARAHSLTCLAVSISPLLVFVGAVAPGITYAKGNPVAAGDVCGLVMGNAGASAGRRQPVGKVAAGEDALPVARDPVVADFEMQLLRSGEKPRIARRPVGAGAAGLPIDRADGDRPSGANQTARGGDGDCAQKAGLDAFHAAVADRPLAVVAR